MILQIFRIFAVSLATLVLLAAILAVTFTTAAHDESAQLEKRGTSALLDSWVIGPLVEQSRPLVSSEIAGVLKESKTQLVKDIPAVFHSSAKQVFKIEPVATANGKYNCGRWLQWACDYVLTPICNKIGAIQQDLGEEIDEAMVKVQKRLVDVTLRAMKKELLLSEEARRAAVLQKRGIRDWINWPSNAAKGWSKEKLNAAKVWYHAKLNSLMRSIVTDLRPEVHAISIELKQSLTEKLPAIVQSHIDSILPDILKATGQPSEARTVPAHSMPKRHPIFDNWNPLSLIKKRVGEWQAYIADGVRVRIANSVDTFEKKLMAILVEVMKRRVTEVAPFFNSDDVKI